MDRVKLEREHGAGTGRDTVQRLEDDGGRMDARATTTQVAQQQDRADASARVAQLREMADLADAATVQRNDTGMPDSLKAGIESLSGMDMSAVRVHRNSDKPAQLNAHAYAQGTDIHLAPGQERHLPHEAWHVVQQMQGRVRPNASIGQVQLNDEVALEHEATVMGEKAVQRNARSSATAPSGLRSIPGSVFVQRATAQLETIGGYEVELDGGGYPTWEMDDGQWHLTMKDIARWHVTKEDRSKSYWFSVNAGVVTGVNPTSAESGNRKIKTETKTATKGNDKNKGNKNKNKTKTTKHVKEEPKHENLDRAPRELRTFIEDHISQIIKVKKK